MVTKRLIFCKDCVAHWVFEHLAPPQEGQHNIVPISAVLVGVLDRAEGTAQINDFPTP